MPDVSTAPAADLYDLIWFPQQDWWGDLAALALPENWGDDGSGRLPILFNYLKYYTRRVHEEGLWTEASSAHGVKLAAFDTGLLSRRFQPIYAVFEENRNPGRQPWVHKDWASPSSSRMKAFDLAEVKRAVFFSDPAEVVYDPRLKVIPNLEHIVDENVDRYPASLQESSYQREAALEKAISVAEARARANWRLAAPQFYWPAPDAPGRVQLLLPLSLMDPATVDLALVLDRTPAVAEQPGPAGASYRAFTVLPLEWAYGNARLITRPETLWLDINTREAVDRAEGITRPGDPL
jgi:Domain of unknown function (DUF3825)